VELAGIVAPRLIADRDICQLEGDMPSKSSVNPGSACGGFQEMIA
jgi:hypothetical protein